MKKLLPILLLIISGVVNAQNDWEIGVSAGASNYLGDIGGKEKEGRDFLLDMKLEKTKWHAGVFGRYKISKAFSANFGFNYTRIDGDDKLSTNLGRYTRNLSFSNDVLDLTARVEWNFYVNNNVGSRMKEDDLKLYVFTGVAGYYHNPKTEYLGQKIKLRELRTEGVEYSSLGVAIPIGLGGYYTLNQNFRIGIDVTWNILFTDYLDDISTVYPDPSSLSSSMSASLANRTAELGEGYSAGLHEPGAVRGDPTDNDSYMHVSVKFGYIFQKFSSFHRRRYGKRRRAGSGRNRAHF